MARTRPPSAPIDDAARLLARRALTRAELAARLERLGHDADAAERAIAALEAAGASGDAALARRYVAARSADGRGRSRVVAELVGRGVDEGIARTAFDAALRDGDVDEAVALAKAVRRRLGAAPGHAGFARLTRVYNALLSEGFEPEAVASALAPYGLERTPE